MKLVVSGRTFVISKEYLEKVAEAAFSFFPKNEGEIELKFVSAKEIQRLNKAYRGKDAVTDVLSFEISETPFLGQVFICYNKARQQAIALNHSIETEVAVLLIHGILHIFGFDHITDDDFQSMSQKELEISKKLGI